MMLLQPGRSVIALAMGALFAATLVGCTAIERSHGYVPSVDEVAALQLGIETRASVAAAIGRPATIGVLESSDWFYVRSAYSQTGVGAREETSRDVLALRFDDTGKLAAIERFGLEDGRLVPISRRVTETGVRSVGLLDQLGRSLGRVSAEQILTQP